MGGGVRTNVCALTGMGPADVCALIGVGVMTGVFDEITLVTTGVNCD